MIIGQHIWSILKIKRRLTWWYWKRYVVLFQMVRHVSTEEEQLSSNELFLFFSSLLSFLVSDFTSTFLKIKYVMSIYICINFDPYSFDYYLFCFQCLLKLIFFSISFLNILFYLIFLSHLVPIIIFLIYFIFQFSPSLFSFI